MIKKQKRIILILGIAAVVLIAAYFAVVVPIMNSMATDEEKVPELLDGEVLGTANRILMFEHVEKSDMQEIEVHNSHGDYAFYRGTDDELYIRGNEGAPYSLTALSSLVVSSGYTLSMERVQIDCADMSEYGLADSDHPSWFTITKTDGEKHTVYIGNRIPTGAGYYARYEGRNAVYILDSSLAATLLADVTALITPILSYPVSSTTYYTVEDFYIARDGELFVWIDYLTEEEKAETASTAIYQMKYPTSYETSSTNYDTILQSFADFEGLYTVAIGNTEETLSPELLLTYGIDMEKPAYELHYKYSGVDNYVYFSKKNEDGTLYAYSMLFNLVAVVDYSKVEWLDWDIIWYVDTPIFSKNINDIAEIQVTADGLDETFTLVGEGTEIQVTPKSTGKTYDADELYNFRQFYKVLLTLGMEDYTENDSTKNCMATLRVKTDSGVETVYKFYPYSTRRCYYTVNGEGEFYTLRDMVEKMISDTKKVVAGLPVDSEKKN